MPYRTPTVLKLDTILSTSKFKNYHPTSTWSLVIRPPRGCLSSGSAKSVWHRSPHHLIQLTVDWLTQSPQSPPQSPSAGAGLWEDGKWRARSTSINLQKADFCILIAVPWCPWTTWNGSKSMWAWASDWACVRNAAHEKEQEIVCASVTVHTAWVCLRESEGEHPDCFVLPSRLIFSLCGIVYMLYLHRSPYPNLLTWHVLWKNAVGLLR